VSVTNCRHHTPEALSAPSVEHALCKKSTASGSPETCDITVQTFIDFLIQYFTKSSNSSKFSK
jgi:hypothetical protein